MIRWLKLQAYFTVWHHFIPNHPFWWQLLPWLVIAGLWMLTIAIKFLCTSITAGNTELLFSGTVLQMWKEKSYDCSSMLTYCASVTKTFPCMAKKHEGSTVHLYLTNGYCKFHASNTHIKLLLPWPLLSLNKCLSMHFEGAFFCFLLSCRVLWLTTMSLDSWLTWIKCDPVGLTTRTTQASFSTITPAGLQIK